MDITFTTTFSDADTGTEGGTNFGALTLAGAGGLAAPAGATSITPGHGTNLVLSGGVVSPDTGGGVTSGTVVFDSGQVWEINAVADEYSVVDVDEAVAAVSDIASAGGKTVKFRSGAITWDTTRLANGREFTAPVVLTGEDGAVLNELRIGNVDGLTVRALEIHETTGAEHVVKLYGPSDNIIIEDCEIHSVSYAPLADLSVSGTYINKNGIQTLNASGLCRGLTVRRCEIHDVEEGVVAALTGSTGLSITDNEIYKTYSDCMKFIITGDGLTAPKDISRNVCYDFMGDPADAVNPHVDIIQFVSNADNDGLNMTNVTIRQNIAWENESTRGSKVQGIVAFTDAGNNVILVDPVISGNSLHISGNHPINIQAINGGTIVNNTTTNPSPDYSNTGACTLRLGDVSTAGVIDARNNVADSYDIYGTATTTGNVTLGSKGATIAYATQFDGTDFLIDDFAECKTQFAVASGAAGAIGSGFGAYGAVRDATGWSFDSSYEDTP